MTASDARHPRGPEMPGGRSPLPDVPFLSVVIPVRNEERFLGQTLSQLRRQDYDPDRVEFLVVDGRSTDRTREIVLEASRADPRIRLLDNPGIRSSSGRNVGFRAARGDIVLVVDGHVWIGNDRLLREVVRCFRLSDADCLGRPQPLRASAPGTWSESIALARATWLGHDRSSFIYGDFEGFAPAASIGAAYRPHVFRAVGYVDESFDACEDLEFNTRVDEAGLRCYTSPGLAVHYFAREGPAALFRQMFRYGFGRLEYLRRHPSRISLSQAAPPLLAAAATCWPLLAILSPGAAAAVGVGLCIYAAVVVAFSAALAARTGPAHFGRFLVVFPAVHLGVGFGLLASVIRALWPRGRTDRPRSCGPSGIVREDGGRRSEDSR